MKKKLRVKKNLRKKRKIKEASALPIQVNIIIPL